MLLLLLLALADQPPDGAIQITHVVWKAGPSSLPKGTEVAVLEGDPKVAGMFTMRLRVPAGAIVPPHWHPRPERVTVLSGEVIVGFGDKVTSKPVTTFRAGDFYVNPAMSHHFVRFAKKSVIQITGEGPWELHTIE
jgi:quercetin dioxygenase-like cupin family protein